jgi:hypothetical protein
MQAANVETMKPRGRADKDGQEQVINLKPLREAVKDLGVLKAKLEEHREKLNAAIKKVAEQSGLNSPAVRRLVNARHSDNFDEVKRSIDQAQLVFDELGKE